MPRYDGWVELGWIGSAPTTTRGWYVINEIINETTSVTLENFYSTRWSTTSNATTMTRNRTTTPSNNIARADRVTTELRAEITAHARTIGARRADEQAQRRVARAAAQSRAEELLLSLLDAEQRETYRLTGSFEVIGSAGGRYTIERGNSGNVVWINPAGVPAGRLCAHPNMREGWMPDQDVAVGQLLALRHDEAAFVRAANLHAGRMPDHLTL